MNNTKKKGAPARDGALGGRRLTAVCYPRDADPPADDDHAADGRRGVMLIRSSLYDT